MKHNENRPFEYSASITQFYYSTPNIPDLFIPTGDATISTNVDRQIMGSSEDKTLFLDEVIVNVTSQTIKDEPVFEMHIVISAVVNILEKDIKEQDLFDIVTDTIPQELYESLKPRVRQFFECTGYPPFELNDFRFADQRQKAMNKNNYS